MIPDSGSNHDMIGGASAARWQRRADERMDGAGAAGLISKVNALLLKQARTATIHPVLDPRERRPSSSTPDAGAGKGVLPGAWSSAVLHAH